MNNKIIIGIVLAVIVIGGLFFFVQPSTQQSQTNAKTNSVTIKNFSFTPDVLTVKQGTKVTWINQDTATHTIQSGSFHSSDLNQGGTFAFTFDTKGSFDYSCGIHPSMTGKIVVE